MKLVLFHGRHTPDEHLEDWGFNGPVLEDVEYLHSTYMITFIIGFTSKEAAARAEALTGWEQWDGCGVLEITFHDGMLVAKDEDGNPAYYGDWELTL
jgi:hypothetical protein